jgi:thiosulfate reductase cytochrome b subunit
MTQSIPASEAQRNSKARRNSNAALGADNQRLVKRHSLVVRITHWINVLCLTMLFMSGLQIFNARPQLDFGDKTNFDNSPASISSVTVEGQRRGLLQIGGHRFDTTGVLGVSKEDGKPTERAFPAWATLPAEQDLATGRSIHFLFAWLFVANGLIYFLWGFTTRHFRGDLAPSRHQWRHIGRSILDHARLRFPRGEEAREYNVIQKLTYIAVIYVLLPGLVLAGWTLSPGLDARFTFLVDIFGGRQTARSVHFIAAFGVVLFVLIHVALVLVSGVFNNMRSMITGWYDLGEGRRS